MECLIERITGKIKVDPKSSCWNWQAHKNHDGYGVISYRSKIYKAHRLMWLLVYGSMPTKCVLHKCDNPSCLNPAHLFLGTHQDNMDDMVKKQRKKGVRSSYHKLTEADVLTIKKRLARKECGVKIAADFHVTKSCINDIKRGKTWSHI